MPRLSDLYGQRKEEEKMKKTAVTAAVLALLWGCAAAPQEQETAESVTEETAEEKQEETMIRMIINDTEVSVAFEDNEAVSMLKQKAAEKDIHVNMHMYGGFEQVGPLGFALPADDVQMTTEAGDIVLYSSDQIVVFYGSNTWAYTKLGRITDKTQPELKQLLGSGDATVTFTAE